MWFVVGAQRGGGHVVIWEGVEYHQPSRSPMMNKLHHLHTAWVATWPGALSAAVVVATISISGVSQPRKDVLPVPPPLPSPWSIASGTAEDDGRCQLSVSSPGASEVELVRVSREGTLERWLAKPSADGSFRFLDLDAGDYQAMASDGHVLQGASAFHCEGGQARAFLHIEPSLHIASGQATTITGVVVDERGVAIAGAEVAMAQSERSRRGLVGVIRVRADEHGLFEVNIPVASQPQSSPTIELLPIDANHQARSHALVLDESHEHIRLTMTTTPMVRGVVYDDHGAPAPHATVALSGVLDPRLTTPMTTTDEQGRFALRSFAGAHVALTAQGGGLVGRVELGVSSLAAAQQWQDVVLQMHSGREVTGVLADLDGSLLAYAPIRYRVRGQGIEGIARTDDHGQFRLAGMPQHHDVEVWAEDGAVGAWGMQVAMVGCQQPLRVLFQAKPF
jgi:hypothetical protein